MGEIGIDRKEYLYDLTFCDLLCIERGYYRRQRPAWEQTRLIAYQVRYCMGLFKNETAKPLTEWMPFYWEKETTTPLSDEEVKGLLADMQAFKEQLNAKKAESEK